MGQQRRASQEKPPEALTAAEKIARRQRLELLQTAVGKQNRGERLTKAELRAIADYEAEQDAERGKRFVRRVPKRLYQEWTGRQTKILHDQARLYGVPLEGATVDLVAVVTWLHEWLAANKHELAAIAKGESGPQGSRGELIVEQVENLRRKNRLLEQTLATREAELLPREVIHNQLARLASILRKAGAALVRRFGNEAGEIVHQALDDFDATLAGEVARAAECDTVHLAPDGEVGRAA